MIIALSHAPGKHAQQLFRGIAALLAPHELLSWQTGAPAPAQDIQILLTLGAVLGVDVERDFLIEAGEAENGF